MLEIHAELDSNNNSILSAEMFSFIVARYCSNNVLQSGILLSTLTHFQLRLSWSVSARIVMNGNPVDAEQLVLCQTQCSYVTKDMLRAYEGFSLCVSHFDTCQKQGIIYKGLY